MVCLVLRLHYICRVPRCFHYEICETIFSSLGLIVCQSVFDVVPINLVIMCLDELIQKLILIKHFILNCGLQC